MAQEPKYPVQTVMKALELLNHLAKNTGNLGAGVSELSDALGIGKSTVHRLLDTLQYYGYIEKSEETNRYRLGWELYKVGLSVPAQRIGGSHAVAAVCSIPSISASVRSSIVATFHASNLHL